MEADGQTVVRLYIGIYRSSKEGTKPTTGTHFQIVVLWKWVQALKIPTGSPHSREVQGDFLQNRNVLDLFWAVLTELYGFVNTHLAALLRL